MITKYYSPEGDGGGMSAPADTGATDSAGAADAAAAGTSGGEGGNEDGATSDATSGETQGVAAATMPDFKAIHERAAKGEPVPEEYLDAYEQWLSNGKPEQDAAEPEQQAEPEQGKVSEVPEWQANVVKMVGAKTPEELPEKIKGLLREHSVKGAALSQFRNLIEGCKANNPYSIAKMKEIYDFDLAALAKPAEPPAAPPAQTQAQAGELTKEMFWNEDDGEKFLNEFNSIKNELNAMKENFSKYEQMIEAERAETKRKQEEASGAIIQSKQMDDVCELGEVYGADFGLSNVPIRSAIEQLNKGSLGENEILRPFAEFMVLYMGRDKAYEELTPIEFYELKNFRAQKGKIAQARIDASKAATSKALAVKPTVGVAGVGQKIAAPNLSDKELEAYYNGKKDMPDEWFDEDSNPTSRMPAKLKSMLGYQAA